MTKLNLKIEHQVPGRVRMKIPAGKDNPELLKQISDAFGVIPGIEEVTINPTTGSVVLYYDTEHHDEVHGSLARHHGVASARPPVTQLDELASRIENEAAFLASHSHTARAVVDFVKKIDREIKLATSNTVDLKIVLALGLIGLTVMEVGATAATPVWVTLAIFTVNHFIEMHPQHNVATADAATHLAPMRVVG
jgi:hypothetical protein